MQPRRSTANKVFELTSIIIGAFIGAGFVSGREVAEYFAKYGFVSIVFAFGVSVLFYLFIKICLCIGNKTGKCDKNIKYIFKKYNVIVNILIIIACLINVGAMIAGCYTIGKIFNSNGLLYILPIVSIILCFIVNLKKFGGISFINKLVVPVLIILICLICFTTIFQSSHVTILITNFYISILGGGVSSIVYVLFNMLLLGVLMLDIGGRYTIHEITISSKVSACLIGILITIISSSIILSNKGVILSDMPLLIECIAINKKFGVVFAVCQFLGIFTTLISSSYLVSNIFNQRLKSYAVCILISLAIGIVISFIGFYNIVDYMYKLTGILSVIFFLLLLKCTKRLK